MVLGDVQVLGPSKKAILLFARPSPKYDNGVRVEGNDGTVYGVLAITQGNDPIIMRVKTPASKPKIQQSVIDEHTERREFLEVSFINFQARSYIDKSGRMALSCKADDVVIETSEVTIDF